MPNGSGNPMIGYIVGYYQKSWILSPVIYAKSVTETRIGDFTVRVHPELQPLR